MVARYLRKLGALCLLWPWHVLAFFSVLTLGALPLVVRLPLEADLHETLPRDTVQALERHIRLFGNSDQAFLLVQTEERSKADLIAFGEALAHKLIPSPLIRQVEFGYSPPLLKVLQDMALDYAPLFVGPEQLESFDRLLTPQGMRAQIRKTLLELSSLGSEVRDRALQEDPLQLRRFAFARLAAWRGSFRFDAFSAYFLSQDGKALLIKIEGQASVDDLEGVKATVGLLRQASQELLSRPAFWGLTVQGTGGYFLAVESDSIIRRDLIRSMAVAVVLICVLIAWSFRRWGVLLYGQIPTLVGLFIALGVFALARPKINALTLGCSVPLVGLGIDFTIHILTQCFAELGQGRTKK
jgi:predicted exporter